MSWEGAIIGFAVGLILRRIWRVHGKRIKRRIHVSRFLRDEQEGRK